MQNRTLTMHDLVIYRKFSIFVVKVPLSIVGGLRERLTRRCYEKEEKNHAAGRQATGNHPLRRGDHVLPER